MPNDTNSPEIVSFDSCGRIANIDFFIPMVAVGTPSAKDTIPAGIVSQVGLRLARVKFPTQRRDTISAGMVSPCAATLQPCPVVVVLSSSCSIV